MPHVTVDPARCEGEQSCILVCPEEVFAMGPVDSSLPWLVRLKVALHGGRQAFVVDDARCTGCLQCIVACPERAIHVTNTARAER